MKATILDTYKDTLAIETSGYKKIDRISLYSQEAGKKGTSLFFKLDKTKLLIKALQEAVAEIEGGK